MTENEAIKELSERIELIEKDYKKEAREYKEVLETAVKALTEIQQYRAIGTVEECREARERQVPIKPKIIMDKTGRFNRYYCPMCGRYFGNDHRRNLAFLFKETYCQNENCGQAIDWSE